MLLHVRTAIRTNAALVVLSIVLGRVVCQLVTPNIALTQCNQGALYLIVGGLPRKQRRDSGLSAIMRCMRFFMCGVYVPFSVTGAV